MKRYSALGLFFGQVNVKVLPFPNAERTLTLPPCCSMTFLTMLRSIPVLSVTKFGKTLALPEAI